MYRFRNLSIKAKLTVLLVSTVAIALFLVCSAFIMIDIYSFKDELAKHISTLTNVVGEYVETAVMFDDAETADELLSSLTNEKSVVYASVYDSNNNLVASYRRNDYKLKIDEIYLENTSDHNNNKPKYTEDGYIKVARTFKDGKDHTGAFVVVADMSQLVKRFWNYGILVSSIILIVLIGTVILSSRLQRVISQPIIRLAKTAKNISEQENYSFNINKKDIGNDEIGTLYNEFNDMIIQIRNREKDLHEAHDRLEERVESRTRMLSKANQELVQEVFERKKAQDELQFLQAEHLETARQAGMAEIATSVLHNVGNVLNSVNVSSSIISTNINNSKSSDFQQAMNILEENSNDIGNYIENHPQGKHLPDFLMELSKQLADDEENTLKEIETLSKNIGHIKDIITVQQSYAGVSGLTERCSLEELIEQSININQASMKRHEISIERNYEEIDPVVIEKHKILQVLVNLISNAKNALREHDNNNRTIQVSLRIHKNNIQIKIKDNGSGIPEEILTKIFAHGFTTRSEGHGFGLHSSALTIKQMGGTLIAKSDGVDTGAEFILSLPVQITEKEAAFS
jgi:two-component system, NtrC family, sensor kinase